mmetsp:Transcript_44401/g.43074  ORF Transcript_44401/g.43074 Transcript_44401/m.43074 type:complete len:93 (-) Transcript_44401:185-463(-)
MLEQERQIDFSEVDNKQKLTCEGAIPDTVNKQKLYDAYVKGSQFNQTELDSSTKFFYNRENPAQCYQFADKYCKDLERVFKEQHRDYAQAFF